MAKILHLTVPHQRRYSGKADWTFQNRSRLEGRMQRYEDGIESSNLKGTNTYGAKYNTPIPGKLMKGSNLYLDGFFTTSANEDKTTDFDTYYGQGRLTIPIIEGFPSSVSGSYRETDNNVSDSRTSGTQASASLIKQFTVYGIKGSFKPGWIYSYVDGVNGEQVTHAPLISMDALYRDQSMRFSHGINFQDMRESNTQNIVTSRTSANYIYRHKAHSISIYADRIERDPETEQGTKSYRVGTVYTYNFDYTIGRTAKKKTAPRVVQSPTGPLFITDLPTGAPLDDAQQLLASAGAIGPVKEGDRMIYDISIFSKINARQRLVIEHGAQRVMKSWLVIGDDSGSDFSGLQRNFEEARAGIIKYMGQPSQIIEKGEFSASIFEDLVSGTFVRLMEWETKSGILRLGIPERIDSKIRVEIVYSDRQVKPVKDNRWGINIIQ